MRPGQQCGGAKLTSAHIKNTRGRVAVAVRIVTKASIVRVFSWGAKYIGGGNEPKKDFKKKKKQLSFTENVFRFVVSKFLKLSDASLYI